MRPKTIHTPIQDYIRTVVLPYDGNDCLFWPFSRTRQGYAQAQVKGTRIGVPRLICELVYGVQPSLEARHLCGRGAQGCVTPRHLVWGTRKENAADRLVHGTSYRGARHHSAKLTELQVREIRESPASARSLARRYGVKHGSILSIKTGKTWGWLK